MNDATHQAIPHVRVHATDRVSDVLARDEALVEVFVRQAAHFEKLRNQTLRRVMARLLTVEEAAKLARVPVARLVAELNEALDAPGVTPARARELHARALQAPPDAPRPTGAREVELDVRDDLQQGREPFARIMAAAGALGTGEVLHLRSPFQPVPLFGVLAKRGFAHETRELGPDDWSSWFWRPDAPDDDASPGSGAGPAATGDAGARERVLDVRGLQPPEPLQRTMAALESLALGDVLVHVNTRVPQVLLPLLAEQGFACTVDEASPDRVLVRIWRR